MLMEELKGPSTIKGHPQSCPPIQHSLLVVGGVELALQCTIRHVFKYQKPVVLVCTVAKQLHQVKRV